MADRVAALMGQRLGLRGRGLEAKLRRARGLLPGHVRAQAEWLAEARRRSGDPRFRMQVDGARAAQAYGQCVTWLKSVDPRRRRREGWLDWAAALAFQLLLLAAGLIALLVWRGFI